MILNCNGVVTNLESIPLCSVPWEIVDSTLTFSPLALDPAIIIDAVGAGFAFAFIPLVTVFSIRLLLAKFFK